MPSDAYATPGGAGGSRCGAGVVVACLLITGVVIASYINLLPAAFFYDDHANVLENATIRSLGRLSDVLHPPALAGVGGRPLANLSFALNFRLGQLSPDGYRVTNLVIHWLAALALFALVLETLRSRRLRDRCLMPAPRWALAVAALWAAHPLQTGVVNYISQRTESLMALCYLCALYAFVRFASGAGIRWAAAAIISCCLGAACKEVIVTAPVIMLLYDRTFVAGSFHDAWRQRRRFYVSCLLVWAFLAYLMMDVRQRGVGLGLVGSWPRYVATECAAILRYVQLAIWPHPLIADYGEALLGDGRTILAMVGALLVLIGFTVIAVRRNSVGGFAAMWFLLILAPTSSVVPIVYQPIAENRTYLPLAGIVSLGIVGLNRCCSARVFGITIVAILCAFVGIGIQRNETYRSERALWADVVAKRPANVRGHANLGVALERAGQFDAAVAEYEAAVRLQPDYADAHANLGRALLRTGRTDEALPHLQAAVTLRPDYEDAQANLGEAWVRSGSLAAATRHFETWLRRNPDNAAAHNALGQVWEKRGDVVAAMAEFRKAAAIDAKSGDAHYNLGTLLLRSGEPAAAIPYLEAARRIEPSSINAITNLGLAFFGTNNLAAAIPLLELAAARQPTASAHKNLAAALIRAGRATDAVPQLERAVALDPNDTESRTTLEQLRSQ